MSRVFCARMRNSGMIYFSKFFHEILFSPKSLVRLLRNPLVLVLAVVVASLFFLASDNFWKTIPFALMILALMTCALLIISKRLSFAFYSSLMAMVVLTAISYFKFKMKGFSLHFFDAAFTGGDPDAVWFLLDAFTMQIAIVVVALVACSAVSIFLFRNDEKLDLSRLKLSGIGVIPVTMIGFTYPAGASEHRYFYYLQGRHTTAFFVSLLDIQYLIGREDLEKRLAKLPEQKPFAQDVTCGVNQPDIFVVLSETQANPADFPQINTTPLLKQQFEKPNGALQPLNVETFGGGTWISNFSFMTGLSATYFGWRSPYLTASLEGKVSGTLPQVLQKCGYRTVAQIPFEYGFVNEGPFLKSIGFEDIYDRYAIDAPHYHMRDKFYFDSAEKIIAEHRKTDDRPLLFLIQTMFPHSPYEEPLLPEISVKGAPFHEDAGVSEYIRRMVIARQDLDEFFDRREQDFGKRGAILLDYGDHQSASTKSLIDEIEGPNALSTPGSLAYRTFFTMRHLDMSGERTFTSQEPLDIGLLGAKMIEFGKLAKSEIWEDLIRIDAICEGKIYNCDKQDQIEQHFARRIEGKQLELASQ